MSMKGESPVMEKNSHFLFYTVNRTQMSHSHWAIFEEFGSIFTRPYNALQYIS